VALPPALVRFASTEDPELAALTDEASLGPHLGPNILKDTVEQQTCPSLPLPRVSYPEANLAIVGPENTLLFGERVLRIIRTEVFQNDQGLRVAGVGDWYSHLGGLFRDEELIRGELPVPDQRGRLHHPVSQ